MTAGPDQPVVNDSVFAKLPADRLTWAVGSIFGERERLESLHALLGERIKPPDNLLYLGNFLGRGRDIHGTVRELLLFRRMLMARMPEVEHGAVVFLRGSQEVMWRKLLQIQLAPNPREVYGWMLAQGIGPTIEAYGGVLSEGKSAAAMGAVALSQWTNKLRAAIRAIDGHDKLLNQLHRAAYVEDGSMIFVNAGLDTTRPLSEQNDALWWGGFSFDRLDGLYAECKRIVRGFDSKQGGVSISDVTASIDGGCGFGGTLAAACFAPDGNVLDVIKV
jgi:serine/threonine protein phosphatase 1